MFILYNAIMAFFIGHSLFFLICNLVFIDNIKRTVAVASPADSLIDDILDFAPYLVIVLLIGGGAYFFAPFDFFSNFIDDPDQDSFELTTDRTSLGIGQEKYVVSEMAYSDVIESMTWSSSDDNIVKVEHVWDCPNNFVVLTGVSEGVATVTASSQGCSRTVSVTVSTEVQPDELKVYNQSSSTKNYAVISGDGFENGLLSLAFNYKGMPVISLCGYNLDMLHKSSKNIGNPYVDFKKVHITLRDNATGNIFAETVWTASDDDDYNSPIIVPASQFSVEHSYSVDYHIIFNNNVSHHVTGSISYHQNDGLMDGSDMFPRSYAWRYDDREFDFKLRFPFGLYSRYHSENGDYVVGNESYSRNSSVAGFDETFFCHSNIITNAIADAVISEYRDAYGNGASVSDQDFADFLLAFVQVCWTYEYDDNQYVGTTTTGKVDYWAFPMETIYSGMGDCEDTSILCATLFHDAGYNSGIYDLPGHAMVAVHIDGYKSPSLKNDQQLMCYRKISNDTTYYGCESTTEQPRPAGIANSSLFIDEYGKKLEMSDISLYVI